MAVDEPRRERVAPPVQAGEVLGQVEPLTRVPDPPALDPHVPAVPEGLAVEEGDVHDREVLFVHPRSRPFGDLRNRQRDQDTDEHHDSGQGPRQAAPPGTIGLRHHVAPKSNVPARRNPNPATARKTSVSAISTATCSGTDCPASMAMTLSASCA